jgi:hypothetical protein
MMARFLRMYSCKANNCDRIDVEGVWLLYPQPVVRGHGIRLNQIHIVAEKRFNQEERPYSKPTLTEYGKVIELTNIVSAKGNKSDHAGGPTKTGIA